MNSQITKYRIDNIRTYRVWPYIYYRNLAEFKTMLLNVFIEDKAKYNDLVFMKIVSCWHEEIIDCPVFQVQNWNNVESVLPSWLGTRSDDGMWEIDKLFITVYPANLNFGDVLIAIQHVITAQEEINEARRNRLRKQLLAPIYV